MRTEAGFTLIEVLVAVLVLSIGLLGLAKLQTLGLHANHGADLRTRASLLAYDIADRMRSNRAAFVDANGNYVDPPADDLTDNIICEWNGSAVTDCDPAEMARFDLKKWREALAAKPDGTGLPDGTGTVCLDATPDDGKDDNNNGRIDPEEYACDGAGSVYAVKIWWTELNEKTGTPVARRFVTTFQP